MAVFQRESEQHQRAETRRSIREANYSMKPKGVRWDRYIADEVILAMDWRYITRDQDERLVKAIGTALRSLRKK